MTNSANYLAFVKLASIRIWLRANESTPWIDPPRRPQPDHPANNGNLGGPCLAFRMMVSSALLPGGPLILSSTGLSRKSSRRRWLLPARMLIDAPLLTGIRWPQVRQRPLGG